MNGQNDKYYYGGKPLEYWRGLTDKYFEAETDDSEEAALRGFLSSPQSAGREFDEARAVMGYVVVGKRVHKRKFWQTRVVRYMSVAASVAVIFVCGWLYSKNSNQCVAYIGGKKYTDTETVLAEMHRSMRTVGDVSDEENVEAALTDIFTTINESKE